MTQGPTRTYTVDGKYPIVADLLRDATGSVLDVGARDCALRQYLKLDRLTYYSADLGPSHDYQLDLETHLALADQSFDYVIALDVLEHVEYIHQAFSELVRITRRRLIIALPSMSSLPRRWSFLRHGHLQTGKYDLLIEHQGDRHRWLTVYPQINAFVGVNAKKYGFKLDHIAEQIEGGPGLARPGRWVAAHGWLPAGWLTCRCIYALTRS